jgi:streptomycin 6-kinase
MLTAGCALARRLHRSPDPEDERLLPNGVTEVAERVPVLGDWMARMGRRLSPAAERIVAEVHEEAALDDGPLVVCHGDLNPGNVLSADRAPWLAVDPLPLIAPAAYDAASLVWSKRAWLLDQPDPAGVLSRRIQLASGAVGMPARDVWAWTLARATAILINRSTWGGYDEAPFVRVIELLCGRPPAMA